MTTHDPSDAKKYRVWLRFKRVNPPESLAAKITELSGEILSQTEEAVYIRFPEHSQLEPFCMAMQQWLGENYSVVLWFNGTNYTSRMAGVVLSAVIICNLDCAAKQ